MEEATASIPVAAASMAELTVDLGPHRVVVQDTAGSRAVDLPFEVDPAACRVSFKLKRQELVITLVRASGTQTADRDPDAAPDEGREPDAVRSAPSSSAPGGPDAMLAELHEGAGDWDVEEEAGEAAFEVLSALLSQGPDALRTCVREVLKDREMGLAFCRVLRKNLHHAVEAGQTNKASAFRRMQGVLRAEIAPKCAAPPAKAPPAEERHAPKVEGAALSAAAARAFDAANALNASCLRSIAAEESSKKGKAAARTRVAQLAEQVGELLQTAGWVVLDGILDGAEAGAVREEMRRLEPHFHASEIWVGNQAAAGAQMVMPDIRGDKILWMCGHHPAESSTGASAWGPGEDRTALQPCEAGARRAVRDEQEARLKSGGARRVSPSERWRNPNLSRVLDSMDGLVQALREAPTAGRCSNLADRSDAMLAVYPETGARFQRHVDNTAGDGRRLTCVCYMNDSWHPEDGGELCLHPPGGSAASVAPLAGRIVLFHADTLPHEVLPSRRHRYSLNVWYYDSAERDRAVAEAKRTGQIGGRGGVATDADHGAARDLLQAVLDGGGGPATRSDLERLATWAEALPPGAAFMVAQVTLGSQAHPGVKPAAVAKALRAMAPADLDSLRRDLSVSRS